MSQPQPSIVPAGRGTRNGYDTEEAGEQHGPNPLLIVHSLLRGRYVVTIVLAVIFAAAGSVAGYLATKPKYESVRLIHVEPTVPNMASAGQDSVMPMFDSFVNSQVALISTEQVVNAAMATAQWQSVRTGVAPEQGAAFREKIDASYPKGTQYIRVAFRDANPDVAKVAVQCLTDTYIKYYAPKQSEQAAAELSFWEGRRRVQSNKLKSDVDQIAKAAGDDVDPDVLVKLYSSQFDEMIKLESEWREAQRVLNSNDPTPVPSAGTSTQSIAATEPAELTPEQISQSDKRMQELLTQRRSAEDALSLLEVRLRSAHPNIVEARKRVAILDRDVAAYAEQWRRAPRPITSVPLEQRAAATLQGDVMLQGMHAKEQRLRKLYEEAKGRTSATGLKVVEIQKLQREVNELRDDVAKSDAAIKNIEFKSSFGGRITAPADAERPVTPVEDKRIKLAAGGAFGGGAFAVALMLGLGFLNRRLVSIHDARLGFHEVDRVLGVLPHVPDDLADPEEAAVAAHCVHHIRTLLQLEPGLPPRRIYSVTSPSSGDGKTTLSIALGMSFAASGAKTLLLDCDMIGGGLSSKMDQMIRPKIGRVLCREGLLTDEQLQQALRSAGRSGRPLGEVLVELGFVGQADVDHALAVQGQSYVGLLDVLGGEPLAECVTGTGRQGLFVLPLGAAGIHHAGQLSPVALQKIFAQARGQFDVVLVDTGPILGSLEAAMVAAQSDAMVLAVSRGVSQALVRRSLDRLVEVGAYVAGMVLNRAAAKEVADFAFSSGSVRSSSRRLPSPEAMGPPDINLGTVGSAVASSTVNGRR